MSFQVGQACYPQAINAAQAVASETVGTLISHGGQTYGVAVDSVAATQIAYRLTPPAGGTPVQLVVPFTAQPCQLLGVDDGIQLGWMVGAAWAGAWALLFVVRAIRGDPESDGNT